MCSDEQCPQRNNSDSCTTKCNTDSNNDDLYKSYRGHISITPQMIHGAVKKLLLRRVYVNSNLLGEYLRRSYPVDSNIKAFNEELNKKLNCAVHVGLIIRHGENAYYLPTLRQEANRLKTAFSAFWEMYKNVIMDFMIAFFMICLQSSTFVIRLRSTINRIFHGREGKVNNDRLSKRIRGIWTAAKVNDRNFHGEYIYIVNNVLTHC